MQQQTKESSIRRLMSRARRPVQTVWVRRPSTKTRGGGVVGGKGTRRRALRRNQIGKMGIPGGADEGALV